MANQKRCGYHSSSPGLLFAVGLLLARFGAVSAKGIFERALGLHVNLAWDMVLLEFGIVMVARGNRARAMQHRNPDGSAANP